MRVVFLTHNYPRWPGDVAGAFLATLAVALQARGHTVRVVAPSDEGWTGGEETDGVAVRRVRYARPAAETLAYRGTMQQALRGPRGLAALAGLWRALRRAAREELASGADLLHVHWWVPGGLAAPPDARFVLTSHGTDAALLRRSSVARRLAAPIYQRARVVTAVSRELASWIEAGVGRHIPPEHVQPMPVPTDHFQWSEGGDGGIVVARLTAQKRVHLALDALACLVAVGREMPLTIVGDGPERAELERRAAALGLTPYVRFLGSVKPADVAELLARADFMLFPAQGEGFGLAAAEALMSGVPVVACWDGGGVLDIVPERGGGRRAIPSGEAIADAALDLLGDPEGPAATRALGAHWRRRLSPDHVAEVCEGWYEEALGPGRGY